MRTTLDLPEDLLKEAMEVSESKTKTKAIILALEELIRKYRVREIKSYKGKLDLKIDIDRLRDRK